MNITKRLGLLFALLGVLGLGNILAQEIDKDSVATTKRLEVSYAYEWGLMANTANQSAFWLRTNQDGAIPLAPIGTYLSAEVQTAYRISPKTQVEAGLVAWGWLNESPTLTLTQGYVGIRQGKLRLWAGRRPQVVGWIGDTLLSSGAYIQSRNALPLPRVQLEIADYIPLFKGVLGFKGFFSHGWFDANPLVEGHYLHQKQFYGRLGKPSWPVRVYGGFNHNVQWGGRVVTANRFTISDRYPSDWIDYWYVMSGTRIPTWGFDLTKYDAIDRGNRLGNHLGSLDMGVEVSVGKGVLSLYRQSIYDDGSLFYTANIIDGLHGIAWRSNRADRRITRVLIEYLNTSSQGGDVFDLNGGPRGRDDYFNHGQYYGWAYGGSTLGTPFISPRAVSRETLAGSNNANFTNNNRVHLLHAGLAGRLGKLTYVGKLSYSANLGTYNRPFSERIEQWSGLLELNYPTQVGRLGPIQVLGRVAADLGGLYPNNVGLHVGVKKQGLLF